MSSDVSTFSPSPIAPPAARGMPARPGVASDRCRDILGDVLRQTVISRLRLAHPGDGAVARTPREAAPPTVAGSSMVEEFVQVLRAEPQEEVDRCVERMARQADGIERFMLDILPRAEIRLVELGRETADDAFDLTLARCRLEDIVGRHHAEIGAAPGRHDNPKPRTARPDRRALLSTSEPEAFQVRLQIAANVLMRDGWDVCCDNEGPLAELVEMVRYDWFAIVVVACDSIAVDLLASAIRAMRRASANQDLRVLLMSAPLVTSPAQLVRVGADAVAADIRQASQQAERLLTLMPPRVRSVEGRG